MSDYSIDMFSEDHDEMLPLLRVLKDIRIPEDNWPKFNVEGTVFSLDPNNAAADTIGFFITKYGREKGTDYGWRFLNVMQFVEENKDALIKERLVEALASGRTSICDELLQVLLGSFSPPKPPVIFPTTSLGDKDNVFSLPKVLEAVKPLIED